MSAPAVLLDSTPVVVTLHEGIHVVRDDLYAGGTKARYSDVFFTECDELVYATPAQGGAQVALALSAKRMRKRLTLFVAQRGEHHQRTEQAQRLGAEVVPVPMGFLSNVTSKAREYCSRGYLSRQLAPFGLRHPIIKDVITASVRELRAFDHVWCAAGSGTLASALCFAFPGAVVHAVSVGHKLKPDEIGSAVIHETSAKFSQRGKEAPFDADPTYEAKAWAVCLKWFHAQHSRGRVLFWNVCGEYMKIT